MLAANIMTTKVLSLTPDNTVGEAIETLAENKIRQIPVLDADKKLLGLITSRTLMQAILPRYITKGYLTDVKFAPELTQFIEGLENLKDKPLMEFLGNKGQKGFFAKEYDTVGPETSTMEIAAIFVNIEKHVDRILVVDDEQRVLGIISPIDVFRKLWKQSTTRD